MNYDQTLIDLMESLKNEKTIPSQYRNSIISDARRLQLAIRGARTMTNMHEPAGMMHIGNGITLKTPEEVHDFLKPGPCICPPGAVDYTCPAHHK